MAPHTRRKSVWRPNFDSSENSGSSVRSLRSGVSGDTTPCRLTGVTLQGGVPPEGAGFVLRVQMLLFEVQGPVFRALCSCFKVRSSRCSVQEELRAWGAGSEA